MDLDRYHSINSAFKSLTLTFATLNMVFSGWALFCTVTKEGQIGPDFVIMSLITLLNFFVVTDIIAGGKSDYYSWSTVHIIIGVAIIFMETVPTSIQEVAIVEKQGGYISYMTKMVSMIMAECVAGEVFLGFIHYGFSGNVSFGLIQYLQVFEDGYEA